MVYPSKADLAYSFTGFSQSQGNNAFPGAAVDAALADLKTTSDETIDFLTAAFRSDGALRNASVLPESLSAAALALIGTSAVYRGPWAAGTTYAVGDVVNTNGGARAYACLAAHTAAASFPTDLAAGRWLLLAATSDAASVPFAPSGGLIATNVQAAIAELDADKQALSANLTALAQLAGVASKIPMFTGPGAVVLIDPPFVQQVRAASSAVATTTAAIPLDDTVPQITEGAEFLSASITPRSVGNLLEVEARLLLSPSVAGTVVAALFVDSTADALAAVAERVDTAGAVQTLALRWRVTAANVAARTYRVRAGLSAAGTLTFNGAGGTRLFGGVAGSSLTVTELRG